MIGLRIIWRLRTLAFTALALAVFGAIECIPQAATQEVGNSTFQICSEKRLHSAVAKLDEKLRETVATQRVANCTT